MDYTSPGHDDQTRALRDVACRFSTHAMAPRRHANARAQQIHGGANEVMNELVARAW